MKAGCDVAVRPASFKKFVVNCIAAMSFTQRIPDEFLKFSVHWLSS